MNSSHLKLIGIAVILAMATLGTGYLFARAPGAPPSASSPAASSTQPKITWSATSIAVILSPWEMTSQDITFTSSLKLSNIVLEPVPAIAPFVTIQPNAFSSVAAGQVQSVHISLAIPASATLGTYDGTIHMRSGSTTYPDTVKVVVNAWAQFSDNALGLSLKYPPELFLLRPEEVPAEVLIQSSSSRINLGGVMEDGSTEITSGFIVGISSTEYAKSFAIDQWLGDMFPNSTVDMITPMIVSGIRSYRVTFRDEIAAGRPTVVIPVNNRIVQVSYGSTFSPDSPEEQGGLDRYNKILQSLQLR